MLASSTKVVNATAITASTTGDSSSLDSLHASTGKSQKNLIESQGAGQSGGKTVATLALILDETWAWLTVCHSRSSEQAMGDFLVSATIAEKRPYFGKRQPTAACKARFNRAGASD